MEDEATIFKPTVRQTISNTEGYSPVGCSSLHPEVDEEARFQKKIKALVSQLADQKDFENVNNFYAASETKQLNLIKYFNAMFWIKPQFILVGEAPGVHGCAHTGIPFTSERLIAEGRLSRHFQGSTFEITGDSYEASAAYIWEATDQMSKPPILFNVFPLHPYKMVRGVMKNRPPLSKEREWGKVILQLVLALFPGVIIITLGNHAKEACKKLGLKTGGHLIHPAYHANEFREQYPRVLLAREGTTVPTLL